MKIELNGLISSQTEWDLLYIGENRLIDVVETIGGGLIKLTYYLSNSPIDKNKVIEDFLYSHYKGISDVDTIYCSGTSWTGLYAVNDIFTVGGHNIIDELLNHLGEYCYLTIEDMGE